MRTVREELAWSRIELQAADGSSGLGQMRSSLQLEWTGRLHGSHWTVSLSGESACSASGSVSTTKTVLTAKPQWAVPYLPAGVYRVDIEDVAKGAGRGAPKLERRGRCWVITGACPRQVAEDRLKQKYCTATETIRCHAPGVFVIEDIQR